MRRVFVGLAIWVATAGSALAADNQAAAGQIARNLKSSGRLQGYNIAVKVSNGTALLKGTVKSEAERQAAEEIAYNSGEVERVISELSVVNGRSSAVRTASHVDSPAPLAATRSVPNNTMTSIQAHGPQALALNSDASYSGEVVDGGYVGNGGPMPISGDAGGSMYYDNAQMPNYAWPSYAAHPNYAGVSYPKQYSASAWPYIGPFYPYPQVPLGWRKVTMEWKDGWWWLDFKDRYRWH